MSERIYIEEALERCRRRGLDPKALPALEECEPEEFRRKHAEFEQMLAVTKLFVGKFIHVEKGNPIIIMITDEQGMILDLDGDETIRGMMVQLGIKTGAILSEKIGGTNSISMVLLYQKPFSLVGDDHYYHILKHSACYSVPFRIMDTQRISGTLTIMTSVEHTNEFFLPLLMIVVDSIERELMLRIQNRKLSESEERYRTLAKELQEVDQRKTEFLSVLSHELRNPLASICNSLHILNHAKPGEDQAEWPKEIIERQVGQLSHLVDDLLDITRITQNKISLQRQQLELNELVRGTVADHCMLFEQIGVHLEADYAPVQVFVNGDVARLRQVVGNLLQNAAKFTDCGGRTRVFVESNASQHQASIRIVDTGSGIASEMLPRLFQPFMQADTALARSHGGLGLGLALSKKFVEMHGGDIMVQSAGIGKGSEFVVHLPLEENAMGKLPNLPPNVSGRSCKVLIIDDNVDLCTSLQEVLDCFGHEVAVAYTGSEGLSKAREFRPEILLCDVGLPGMDGYEVARAFRLNDELKNVFLIAMTGYALPKDIQQAVEAGFDMHLAKPVDLLLLEQILAEVSVRQTSNKQPIG